MSDEGFVTGIDRLLLDFAGRSTALARGSQIPWDHGGYSITAIILAVAAVEAHVGEWLGRPENSSRFKPETVKDWKDKRLPAYEVIKAILTTLSKDVGAARWYNRLRGLYVLRNLAVHYYPEHRPTGSWPDELEPYVTNHTIEPGGDTGMDWTSRILISSVAEQALCIAFDAIRGFDSEVG